MGFEKRDKAKKYEPKEGDSLKSIAEREAAAGNPITWQELAKFNWGTDDQKAVNECLRDKLGCRKRDDAKNFVISTEDEPQEKLLIPVRFAKPGLATERTHTLRVRKKPSPAPQFLECCEIPGVTFEFDKSFIRPSVVDHLKKLEEAVARHPEAKIMIFGHTDKVGSEQYNKELSERRARSTLAFITNDVDTWEELFDEEEWGTDVIRQILADFGGPYDPGSSTASLKQAVRRYQQDRGLSVDGIVGSQTRKAMFREYMTSKHDVQLTPDQFMEPKFMGCGEFNPVENVETAHEPNRRVVFYLFHPDRLPTLPCKLGDIAPCKKQMTQLSPRFKESFKCSFYDSLARECPCEGAASLDRLIITLLDADGKPRPGVPYVLVVGGQTFESSTTAEGRIDHFILRASSQGTLTIEGTEVALGIGDLDSIEQLKGVQQRLNNLGFDCGPPSGAMNEKTQQALRNFQNQHGMDATGEVTPETRAKLREIYGH